MPEFKEVSAKRTLLLGLLILITGRYILMVSEPRPRLLWPESLNVELASYFNSRNLAGGGIYYDILLKSASGSAACTVHASFALGLWFVEATPGRTPGGWVEGPGLTCSPQLKLVENPRILELQL